MADFPDFEKIVYRKPEFSSISESVWLWFMQTVSAVSPGHYGPYTIYTIPTGYKAIISDIGAGAEFMGESKFYIPDGDNIWWAYNEPYETKNHSFVLPPVGLVGEKITHEFWNRDTINGNWRAFMSMWQVAGSKPKNPKRDDPLERFLVGDFSTVNQLILPNGEVLFLFHKRGEGKENYLRFKNYGLADQKKLASFHLKLKEANELLDITHIKPEKVKEALKKYEEKYKSKAPDFSD